VFPFVVFKSVTRRRHILLLPVVLFAVVGISACGGSTTKPILVNGKCPRREPTSFETEPHSGTKGQTVPHGSKEAEVVICSYESSGVSGGGYREWDSERHLGRDQQSLIAALVTRLNSLAPGREGEFNCQEITKSLSYFISFRYADGSETQAEGEADGCGSVRNVEAKTFYEWDGALISELATLVAKQRRPIRSGA
jgi:hypothetical protein